MGTYRVKADGNAPAGLSVGDFVVTGGGVYLITGFKSNGSYKSQLIDSSTTTYNYKGSYDTPPSDMGGVASENDRSGRGGSDNKDSGSEDSGIKNSITWDNLLDQLQNQLDSAGNDSYKPVRMPDIDAMSFEEAMALAEDVLKPQYSNAYRDIAQQADQKLEKAGLYDTVYGQALAADAQRDIAADLSAAVVGLALELSDASQEQAQKVLEMAVKERQFGANYDADQKKTALKYLMQLIS